MEPDGGPIATVESTIPAMETDGKGAEHAPDPRVTGPQPPVGGDPEMGSEMGPGSISEVDSKGFIHPRAERGIGGTPPSQGPIAARRGLALANDF